jgi:iron complex transport system substrate-binding protein
MKYLICALSLILMTTKTIASPVTIDNCGETLTFEKTPTRMVVHDINMADMAFTLGLQNYIVGLTGISGWYKTSADFDERRGDIVELAPKYPSIENLLAVEPDLFFAGWYYGMKPGGDVTPDTLAPHGIKTLILSESCSHQVKQEEPASLDLLYNDVLRLGSIFRRTKVSETLVELWKAKVEAIKGRVANKEKIRVFLYDSGKDAPFTIGKYAISNAMIEAAGGVSVTNSMDISWGKSTWEAVAAADPEFLILLDYQTGGGAKDLFKFLQEHPVMKNTIAVKNSNFISFRYEDLTPGPANIVAIDKLARAMHKDAF